MKQIIRLAWSYLKYYKKQTMALFLGIVCPVLCLPESVHFKRAEIMQQEKMPAQNPETGTTRCAVTQTGLRSLRKRIRRGKKSRATAWNKSVC